MIIIKELREELDKNEVSYYKINLFYEYNKKEDLDNKIELIYFNNKEKSTQKKEEISTKIKIINEAIKKLNIISN